MGIVSSGTVAVMDPASEGDVVIRVLQPGGHFGEISLYAQPKGSHRRASTIQALSWVQLQASFFASALPLS